MEVKQPSKRTQAHRRNPHMEGLLAAIDFVIAFLFLKSALDTGSLLQYSVSFVALALGIRSLLSTIRIYKARSSLKQDQ